MALWQQSYKCTGAYTNAVWVQVGLRLSCSDSRLSCLGSRLCMLPFASCHASTEKGSWMRAAKHAIVQAVCLGEATGAQA